jgi:GNAT superfamily N-acetyltransferase
VDAMDKSSEIIVRDASLSDIPAMASLMVELGYPTTEEDMRMRFTQIADHPDMRTLVAVANGSTVGLLGLSKNWAYERNGLYVRVLALVVSSAHRARGIGWKLLRSGEDWAKQIGATRMIVHCGNREERVRAKAFYQLFGFELNSSGYVKNLIDG